MTAKTKRPRKPRPFYFRASTGAEDSLVFNPIGGRLPYLHVRNFIQDADDYIGWLTPAKARRLGNALVKFADWAESKEKK